LIIVIKIAINSLSRTIFYINRIELVLLWKVRVFKRNEEMNMSKSLKVVTHSVLRGGIATIVLGAVLMAIPFTAAAQYKDYEGPEFCKRCHEKNYNDWKVSGHPYKLMKSSEAQNRPIPLPDGLDWDDITYVIGGYKWKSRYLDDRGYIYTPAEGKNQYNNLTGEWSDYHAGAVDLPYNCGRCHTTAWIENPDPTDLTHNQDGLPGIWGTFYAGGIQCEQCHGPGFDSMEIDDSAEACGVCHSRGEPDTIPASGGFIQHHEQYNEHMAGAHARLDCVTCHDPHKRGEFSIKETAECGVSCHASKMASFKKTSMYDYGVKCKDCHMPFATKSAQQLAPHMGDLQTHIFRIDTDPTANMFTDDGAFVKLDSRGKAKVTMDFACQRCHLTASLDELALYAKGFHDDDKGLADIGLDPGLSGTWWNPAKDGEGFLLEVGFAPDSGAKFLYASFYTYGPDGEQTWLVAALTSEDGTTGNVTVYQPAGGTWGNPSTADTGIEWGTGTFTFPTCTAGSFTFTPNATMMGKGYTAISYNLERILDSGIACPTFVNNEMAAATR
jgi:hypothetical protein